MRHSFRDLSPLINDANIKRAKLETKGVASDHLKCNTDILDKVKSEETPHEENKNEKTDVNEEIIEVMSK